MQEVQRSAQISSRSIQFSSKQTTPTASSASASHQLIHTLHLPPRKRKSFTTLKRSQQNKRAKAVRTFAQLTDTPLSAVLPAPIPPVHLLHLPTSTRPPIGCCRPGRLFKLITPLLFRTMDGEQDGWMEGDGVTVRYCHLLPIYTILTQHTDIPPTD